jgi:hypothetical protein
VNDRIHSYEELDPTFHPIPGFDGYEGNLRGEVRSWRKGGPGGYRLDAPKMLAPFLVKGYLKVSVKVPGVSTQLWIHSIVLTIKSGPKPDGLQCRHMDGNKLNNHPDNLVWGTSAENVGDNVRLGTTARGARNGAYTRPDRVLRGALHPSASITEERAREIIARLATCSNQSALAREMDLPFQVIKGISSGRSWKHLPRGWGTGPCDAARERLRGEDAGNAKLTERHALAIIGLAPIYANLAQLARDFGVSFGAVSAIVNGYSWKHLARPWTGARLSTADRRGNTAYAKRAVSL